MDDKREIANVDGAIPTFCIVGQVSKPSTVIIENEDYVGPLLPTKELLRAQAIDLLCQNL